MLAGVRVRFATDEDLAAVHLMIERAYRGMSAREGWTHEADLIETPRTDIAALSAMVAHPHERLIVAENDAGLLGSVHVAQLGDGCAYMGMLCVEPRRQSSGIGRRLMDVAEATARDLFGATRIEMTVIDIRRELIRFYERRGYRRTGEHRDFPIVLDPPLSLAVLEKPLG